MIGPRVAFIYELVKPTVNHLGFELWGVEQTGVGRHKRICIFIDAPQGISISDCEMVSQQLETLLAVEDAVAGTYDLEVSSPGIDRLLFTKNQYGRYLDSKLDLRLHMPIDGSRHLRGILQSVAADSFALLVGNELKAIPFVQVRRARLVPNFE